MSTIVTGIVGILFLLILILLGTHIGVALGFTGFIGCAILIGTERAASLTISTIFSAITNYTLVVIPLFIFMGLLAAGGGISAKLYDSLTMWFGRLKSGLGVATLFACTAFGTVCGSGLATAAAFSKISAPEMRRHGYTKELAYGICASGGAIGMLIPPSLLAVFYGILSGLSVGKLLIGGVGAGITMALLYSLTVAIVIKIKPQSYTGSKIIKASWKERFATLPSFWPVFLCGGVIFIGIFSGIFTPTEAAAVASFVMIIIIAIINPKKVFKMVLSAFKETITMSCMIFLVLAGAMVFSRFMVLTGIADAIINLILSSGLSNMGIVILFVILYLAAGTLMESISMLSITIPTLHPVIVSLGINPIWFAILVIAATQIGLTTPPVGSGAYATKGAAEADVSIEDIFRGCIPFLIAAVFVLALLIVFPSIITFLPGLIR